MIVSESGKFNSRATYWLVFCVSLPTYEKFKQVMKEIFIKYDTQTLDNIVTVSS